MLAGTTREVKRTIRGVSLEDGSSRARRNKTRNEKGGRITAPRGKGGSAGLKWVGARSLSVDPSHLLKSEVGVAFDVGVIQSTKAPKYQSTLRGR